MCSHESITWTITDNSVTDRMLENSLIHKFRPSRKIRKGTKLLNTEIKKHCGVANYQHYVELKTNVIRNLVKDTDTSDSSSLSDVDYDIIYNSSKRAKYKAKNFQNYVSISEENYKGCNRRTVIHKKKSRGRSTERKVQVRKSPRLNPIVSEKCINTGWQEVINKNNSVPHKRSRTNISNNKRNILKSNDRIHLKAQSNKQSLSPQLDSQISSTSSIMKPGNKYVRQNHEDFDAIDNKLSSEDNKIFNKTKPVSKKIQNKKDQSATINRSNIELDSHGLHHHSSLPQSTSLENSTNADNELNSLVKSKDNTNESTAVIESSINAKNCNSAYINYKPKLLKDVKRNLIPALEKVDSMNNSKDITDKSIGGELSYDQLLPDIEKFDQHHSTPLKKIQTNVPNKDSSSDVLQDQQKDSGIDEDSQDKLVKIEKSNKTPMNQNMEKNAKKILISSLELKKTDEVFETMEDCEEVVKDPQLNDILREQINKEEKIPSGEEEMKNSPQLNQINMNVETNEENEHFVKTKGSSDIQKQQLLSPKNYMKEAHSNPCSLIQEKEDERIVKIPAEEEKDTSLQLKEDNAKVDLEVPSINHKGKQNSKEEKESSGEKIKNFSQLNQTSNVTEIHSINREDRTHFVKSENSLDVQKQQVLSPKENHIKDVHLKSNNILDENNRQTNDEKEENNFFQLNQVNKNAKGHLINQEDKTCMKQDTHDTQKHETLLPKITCTEILNKKYKLIYKKDDVVKSNIEKIDKIDSTNISNENPSIRKNTLVHCPDVVDHNTDNLQETAVNEEEIETPMTLETDNEEDNMNYMSPQIKKRLQQQARLNLVVNSDSSESDDEYVTTKTSQKHIQIQFKDSSNTNHCNEDDNLSNDEINCASKQTETDISCSENICIHKEATSAIEEVKLDSTNTKEDIKETESLISCTYENNDSLQSATNKNPLQDTPNCENVHNDNQSQLKENLIESLQLRVSDGDVSCNSKKSINEFQEHKQPMLNKENTCTKSNQNEEAISTEFKTRHESEHKQSTQASIKCSNIHLNSSCQYRPRNLQQLIEDQDLFVETIPASFTLTNLSKDEEAFILNVPSKVLQSNLQGQVLTLKEKSIKLNECKYRIVCKEVGTTSCIFATGKKQKPYKIINIKNISTITVREKLPQDSRKSDELNSNSTVSSVPKVLNKNQQTDTKRNSKSLKIFNKKRKREESSGDEYK
ncbi:PREDICTED: putative uncharacterized protein DDB_G0282133 isoform X2 [Trachymyrmex cornetzi]|uniref:putative uncharacterized protein DDB_G0282133 isoform X2 n=1 Tax=Trachymyrmex cornetzi TaxID=471704 RepID=UPI00084F5099|nr:PREDICTED: putative uncharacterized protein DDB_G0282133 isoform X2 [Trachymyrmex cornetzi]